MLDFVRTRLLPQDLVAVLAYGRACDFTSDHQRVGRIVERFTRENDAIEQETTSQIWGLAGVYGSRSLPTSVQARIDRIFQDEAAIPSRYIGSAANSASADRTEKDVRDAAPLPADPGFDAFVATNLQMLQDLGSIYAAIAYLREFEGEKHVLVVTESGFLLPRIEDDQDLVNAASDARVAISIIQTGGMTIGASALQFKSMRAIAEDTGGIASLAEYSRRGVERLDAATRAGYLLGYYPSNAKLDGRFRTIQVKVNRPNVRVLFRHGYYAREEVPLFSRRGFIAHNRLIGAAVYKNEMNGRSHLLRVDIPERDEERHCLQVPNAAQERRPHGHGGRLRLHGGPRGNLSHAPAVAVLNRLSALGSWLSAFGGDLLRRNPDGTFVYCGRADEMAKVSGRWLAPAEVENCLLQHAAVREVAIVPLKNADGLVKPIAFVVANRPSAAHPSEQDRQERAGEIGRHRSEDGRSHGIAPPAFAPVLPEGCLARLARRMRAPARRI